MRHFEREAKLNMGFLAIIFVGPLVIGVIASTCYFNSQPYAIDRCLDAGGSYNYEAEQCDFTTNHPSPK